MSKALIGYTGFVGGHLNQQIQFTDSYNSTNIQEIQGKEYDMVYCAGAPGKKWVANQHPEEDQQSIHALIENLKQVKAKQFVLISTVDVYAQPRGVDESTSIDINVLSPYGKHRFELEKFVLEEFNDALVVRLPGLFGKGLKKNIIFDFLHNNQLENINSASVFQFYNLERLSEDINTAIANDLSVVNFATEPTSVQEVAKECFEMYFLNSKAPQANYDIHTQFSECFGGSGPYLIKKEQVLTEMKSFVQKEKVHLGM